MSSSFTAPFSTPSCSIFPLAHDSPPLESDRRPDSEGPTYPPFMFVNSWSDELAAVACLAHLTAQNFIPILNEPRDDLPVWSGEGLPSSGLLSQVTAPSTQRSRTIVFHSDMERTDFSGDSNHPSSHGGTKHTCNICGKDFQRPCSLETHMNMHYGRKPFICIVPECRKAFSVKSNALRHMRMHGPSMGYPSIAEHAAAPYVVNFAPIETAASYSIPALAESITDSAISL
ncbi:hypothetical protein C8R43DRAFT_1035917 [Mycena crocata]|nr:hypothetical protein C8R43DRAFT_1035917 [Mycena crocata]